MGRKERLRQEWNKLDEKTVVLHQFPRAKVTPSASSFVVKLETYLRMAKVEYVSDFEMYMSEKGKCPWITVNKQDVADSQLAVEHLNETLGIDLESHLTPEQKAVSRTIRSLLEDHYYFIKIHLYFVVGKMSGHDDIVAPTTTKSPLSKFLHNFFQSSKIKNFKNQTYSQGLGRHSVEVLEKWKEEDVRTISALLGDKNFMMGDEPSLIDCTVFGFMALDVFMLKEEDSEHPRNKYKNIYDYVMRMKEKYYPDWEDLLYKDPPPPQATETAATDEAKSNNKEQKKDEEENKENKEEIQK